MGGCMDGQMYRGTDRQADGSRLENAEAVT